MYKRKINLYEISQVRVTILRDHFWLVALRHAKRPRREWVTIISYLIPLTGSRRQAFHGSGLSKIRRRNEIASKILTTKAPALFHGNILPGLRMPLGSNSALICLIHSRLLPCSAGMYFFLPRPTPCSPVAVPPKSSALDTRCLTT